MKTIETTSLSFCILIMISIGLNACRTNKLTDSSKDRKTWLETTNSISRDNHNINYTQSRAMVDSIGQLYHFSIFPTDTFFQFSPQDGFRGKASKVELRGALWQLRHIRDSALFFGSRQRESNGKSMKEFESSQLSHSESVEKSKIKWWLCLAAAVVIGVGIFSWFRRIHF